MDEGLFVVHKSQPFLKEGTTVEEVSHVSLDMQGAGPGGRLQCSITQWCPKDHCDKDASWLGRITTAAHHL